MPGGFTVGKDDGGSSRARSAKQILQGFGSAMVRFAYKRGYRLLGRNSVKQHPAVRALTNRLVPLLRRPTANVLGHTMVLDPNDSLRLSIVGVFEPFETSLVERLVRPGDVFVDVGAHIGYYTLLAARGVGERGRVVALEPHPKLFDLLEHNVNRNGYNGRVELHRAAAAAAQGEATLHISLTNSGDHSLVASRGHGGITVDQVTLDAIVPGVAHVLKIDVQGAEPLVLAGAEGLIARSPDLLLLTEVCDDMLEEAAASGRDYLRSLEACGFELFLLDEPNEVLVRWTGQATPFVNVLGVRDRSRLRDLPIALSLAAAR